MSLFRITSASFVLLRLNLTTYSNASILCINAENAWITFVQYLISSITKKILREFYIIEQLYNYLINSCL